MSDLDLDPARDRRSLLAFIAADPALSQALVLARETLDGDPGHDSEHCLRVALWTLRLGGGALDARCAVAAALLHDIVNVPKDSPERARASELSAERARTVLEKLDFGTDDVGSITEAIRDHA